MADILSLKSTRKAKARAEKQQTAAENRTRYGQPKAAKQKLKAEKALSAAKLDGHKRDK
jgi:hypothetical protein